MWTCIVFSVTQYYGAGGCACLINCGRRRGHHICVHQIVNLTYLCSCCPKRWYMFLKKNKSSLGVTCGSQQWCGHVKTLHTCCSDPPLHQVLDPSQLSLEWVGVTHDNVEAQRSLNPSDFHYLMIPSYFFSRREPHAKQKKTGSLHAVYHAVTCLCSKGRQHCAQKNTPWEFYR